MIVIDTNVFSALMRPEAGVLESWLASINATELFTTTITRAEIRFGLERLPAGNRREDLQRRADALFAEVAERTLAFDAAAADRYGYIVARRQGFGRPISVLDAQIASIAWTHGAQLATRNVRDFVRTGVKVVDPFAS